MCVSECVCVCVCVWVCLCVSVRKSSVLLLGCALIIIKEVMCCRGCAGIGEGDGGYQAVKAPSSSL